MGFDLRPTVRQTNTVTFDLGAVVGDVDFVHAGSPWFERDPVHTGLVLHHLGRVLQSVVGDFRL